MREFACDARQQHLTAVPDGHEPRYAIDRRSEVVAVALFRVAGVQAHSDLQSANAGEIFLRKGSLCLDGRVDCLGSRGKGAAKRVAHGLENVATTSDNGGAHEMLVTRDGSLHRLAMRLPTLRRPLDIGK